MAKFVKEKDLTGEGIHFAYEVFEFVERFDVNDVAVIVKDKTSEVSEQEILTRIEYHSKVVADAQEILAEIEKIKVEKLK